MKGNRKYFVLTSILMIFMLGFAPFGLVQSSVPPSVQIVQPSIPDPLSVILAVAVAFASLVGTAALTTALIQIGKLIGFISDGAASQWAAGFNLLFFIGLVALGIFRPDLTLEYLDGYAGRIAQALVYILGFVVQITGSKPIYSWFKSAGVPVLGRSLSDSVPG